jgi:hypothetical protein
MPCQNCGSNKIMSVNGKTSDMCGVSIFDDDFDHWINYDGYVPRGLDIGGGDYIEMEICIECGRVQGSFPKTVKEIADILES